MSREKNVREDAVVNWTPFWMVKHQSVFSRSRNQAWLAFRFEDLSLEKLFPLFIDLNEYCHKEPTEQRRGYCPSSEWNKFTLPVDRVQQSLSSAFVLMEAPDGPLGLLLSLVLLGKTVSGHQFAQNKEKP